MPVQNFGGRTPKKFQGPKTCKIWPDFGRLHETLPRDVLLDGGDNAGTTFRGHRPLKIWECKKRAKFSTFN